MVAFVKSAYKKHITLRHLLIRGEKHISLDFKSDKILNALVKEIEGIGWSNEFEIWHIRNQKKNLELIFKTFKGVAWLNCNYFFSNRPLTQNNGNLDLGFIGKER